MNEGDGGHRFQEKALGGDGGRQFAWQPCDRTPASHSFAYVRNHWLAAQTEPDRQAGLRFSARAAHRIRGRLLLAWLQTLLSASSVASRLLGCEGAEEQG